MPKYYVQSGNLQVITTASDPRGAAIWAVHRAMSQTLPFLTDEPMCLLHEAESPRLDETVMVSEQGFGGQRRNTFETLVIVGEWNELLLAIERIEQRFATAEVAC